MKDIILKQAFEELKLTKLIEESGIDKNQAYRDLYSCGMVSSIKDACINIDTPAKVEFIDSQSAFADAYENGLITKDNLYDGLEEHIHLYIEKEFSDVDYFILDFYYSKYKYLPIFNIPEDKRQYVYEYLIQSNKESSITFGLNQKWDIDHLDLYEEQNKKMDFGNWTDLDTEVFKGEYRQVLLRALAEVFDQNAEIYITDNFKKLFNKVVIDANGFDVMNYLKDCHYSYFAETIFNGYDGNNEKMMLELKKYDISIELMLFVIDQISSGDYDLLFPSRFVNTDSYIAFIESKNALQGFEEMNRNFMRNCTSEEDAIYRNAYETRKLFNVRPAMCTFKTVMNRLENTGNLIIPHLINVEVNKTEIHSCFEFLLQLNSEMIDKIVKTDRYRIMHVFQYDEFKNSQKVELLRKHPQLISYFADF